MKNKFTWLFLFIALAALAVLGSYIAADYMRADQTPPVITIDTPELSLSVHDDDGLLLQGVTAWDDTDGDVTDSLVVESVYGIEDQRATITYAAADSAGNVAKAERTVHYTDYQSPRFTLDQSLTFELGSFFNVMEIVGAEDVLEGDLLRRVKATLLSNALSVTEEGIHQVQFRVTNDLGDTVQLVLPVEVYPMNSYNAELLLTDYLLYLPQGTTFDPYDHLLQLNIPGTSISLAGSLPEGTNVRTNGTVQTDTPGVYPVSYTVTCQADGTTWTGYSKLCVIIEG